VDAEGRIVGPVAANDGVSGGAGRGGTGHARPGTLSRS
jgi:hypothetical protein